MVYNKVKFGKHALVKKWCERQKVSKKCKNIRKLNFFWGKFVLQCMVLELRTNLFEDPDIIAERNFRGKSHFCLKKIKFLTVIKFLKFLHDKDFMETASFLSIAFFLSIASILVGTTTFSRLRVFLKV